MTITAPTENRIRPSSLPNRRPIYALIALIFLAVIWLEYTTPSVYVFGYLYTGAIILTYRHLGRTSVMTVTLAAVGLTLLNLVFPIVEIRNLPTLANRLIATTALLITGYFTERNRFYEGEIAHQRAYIQTQAQLADMREDFASTLTHDLKTPLLGAIETIKSFRTEQFGGVSKRQHQVLDLMMRSHDDTLQLVEAMLDVYRNDAEGLVLNIAAVELRSLLSDTVTALTPQAQARQVQVIVTPASRSFWVQGDVLQLRRVFENLLANAIAHTPTGTTVQVTCQSTKADATKAGLISSPRSTQWEIQIQDAGPGIAANELPYLFVRFYQGHSSRQHKGYGLGLYLSRQIVAAHGGKIWAESPDEQGATFHCCLPATTDR